MTDMEIPQAAIELGAQALFVEEHGDFVQPDHPWLSTFEGAVRGRYTRRAARVLEAALPHLLTEVKSMCETAAAVALKLGRKEAAEEIATAIEDMPPLWHRLTVGKADAAEIARNLSSGEGGK